MGVKPEQLGRAALEPAGPVIAGAYGEWRLTVTVGAHGIDDGGSIIVARRDVSDWELPQFDRPRESGYVTAFTTAGACLQLDYDPTRYVRPWRAALVVDVFDGALAAGDAVTIVYGDRGAGGPGMRTQTFAESAFTFKVLVDAFGSGVYYDVPDPPRIAVTGGYPDALHVVAPSVVAANQPFAIGIRAVDSYGNPSPFFTGEVALDLDHGAGSLPVPTVRFTPEDGGARRIEGCRLTTPGIHTIGARSGDFAARSNPCRCVPRLDDGMMPVFWGDLHGQTEQTVGTGTLEEYLAFGREKAFLDFTSWQGNDFQITPALWTEVNHEIKRHHEPGRFVTFLGYEWSGLSPAGGDYNVYYRHDDEPIYRSSHWQVADDADLATDRYPISALWQEFADRDDVLTVAHVGGRYANLDTLDDRLTPVIEVHSHHGTFEWMIDEAFRRGLRVGFICGSDDHTCRPGLSYPTLNTSRALTSFDVRGGLTAVFAPELTREALWQALRDRR